MSIVHSLHDEGMTLTVEHGAPTADKATVTLGFDHSIDSPIMAVFDRHELAEFARKVLLP